MTLPSSALPGWTAATQTRTIEKAVAVHFLFEGSLGQIEEIVRDSTFATIRSRSFIWSRQEFCTNWDKNHFSELLQAKSPKLNSLLV